LSFNSDCQILIKQTFFIDWLAPAYEETLNADLPTIPLITIQHCTNNFSETSKLGEGGFGSVYKVFMIWNF